MACGMESLAGYFKTGFGPYLQALTFHFCGFWHIAGHITKLESNFILPVGY